ncbi:GntR family transcriptional regulator [Lentzea sp. NPDC051213]|uniref:GntR family transcriptional regulator n=1 Tax=Lentzea sp. NPDC051213 TaxID=3364126 RepID=UPI0037A1539F
MESTWTDVSAPYLTPRTGPRSDAWAEEAAAQGRRGTQKLREVGEVLPPSDVARALGLGDGESAIVRRRTMFLDDQPFELTDSYYPLAVASGTPLAEPRKVRGGAPTVLANLGRRPHRIREDVSTRPATDEERVLLELDDMQWVLILFRTAMAEDGTPIEVSVMTMVPTNRRLTYELNLWRAGVPNYALA